MSKKLFFTSIICICGILLLACIASACTRTDMNPDHGLSESLPELGEPYESDMSIPDTGELGSIDTTGSREQTGSSAYPSGTSSPDSVPEISVYELMNKLVTGDIPKIVDLRPTSSFDRGHIESAVSIPIDELSTRYKELPDNREIIVYAECA